MTIGVYPLFFTTSSGSQQRAQILQFFFTPHKGARRVQMGEQPIVFFGDIPVCQQGHRSLLPFAHMAIENGDKPAMMLIGQHRVARTREGFFQRSSLRQRFIKMKDKGGAEIIL